MLAVVGSELVMRRRLSAEQQERRQRVIEVATALATEGGYDAVVMKDVAERSGVALATLYRWFASKDHLLCEVLLEWGARVEADLRAAPPAESAGAERILDFVRRLTETVAAFPRLAAAVTRAVVSFDPNVLEHQDDFDELVGRWIDLALGDLDVPNRESVIEVLEAVCFANLIGLVGGRTTLADFGARLERAAQAVLSPAPLPH
jgi:AcrR family transcriptional regulator